MFVLDKRCTLVELFASDKKIKNFMTFYFQSDLFGSLNDSGLLSRASEALMAVDVKHPVVSCSAAAVAAAAAASHGFTQIKSDVMYPHHTSSQSIMSSRGNQVRSVQVH
jgi:hypothetical protein